MAKKKINMNDHDRNKIILYDKEGFNDYIINHLEDSKSRFFLPYDCWIGKHKYDFIGKLENFEENMKLVCNDLKISFKNVHINKSNIRHIKSITITKQKILLKIYIKKISIDLVTASK